MVSGPFTSWQVDGKAMETGTDFILGGSKTAVDGDCSLDKMVAAAICLN